MLIELLKQKKNSAKRFYVCNIEMLDAFALIVMSGFVANP